MLEIFSPPDFQGPLNTHKRFQRAKSLSIAISQSQKNFIHGSIQILEGRLANTEYYEIIGPPIDFI
jgi:hypothetical protein